MWRTVPLISGEKQSPQSRAGVRSVFSSFCFLISFGGDAACTYRFSSPHLVDLSRRGRRSVSLTGRANGVRTLLFCLVVLPPQSENAERSSSVVAKKGEGHKKQEGADSLPYLWLVFRNTHGRSPWQTKGKRSEEFFFGEWWHMKSLQQRRQSTAAGLQGRW